MPEQKQLRFVYDTSPIRFYEAQGKRFAEIEIMDDQANKQTKEGGGPWRLPAKIRAKMIKSLFDSPLLGDPPPGERGNFVGGDPGAPHEGLYTPVGHLHDIKSNGVLKGVYEIDKDYAWRKIQAGEWQAVSPSVLAFDRVDQDGVHVITDGAFNHVLFVKHPAYPNAGVKQTYETSEPPSMPQGFYAALQAAIQTHAAQPSGGAVVGDGAARQSPNQSQAADQTGMKFGGKMSTETTQTPEEFDASWYGNAPSNYMKSPWTAGDFLVHTKDKRALPVRDPHSHKAVERGVRAALSRFHSTHFPPGTRETAKNRLIALAHKFGIQTSMGADLQALVEEDEDDEELNGEKGEPNLDEEQTTEQKTAAIKAAVDAAVTPLQAKIKTLEDTIAAQAAKSRVSRIATLVQAALKIELTKDAAAYAKTLEPMNDAQLDVLESTLTQLQANIKPDTAAKPVVKFTPEQAAIVGSTLAEQRKSRFGHEQPLNLQGKVAK